MFGAVVQRLCNGFLVLALLLFGFLPALILGQSLTLFELLHGEV
jgi:hypothetical protein